MDGQKGVLVMTDLHAIRAALSAQYYPTRRGLLVRAVIVALDALIAYDRALIIREHIDCINSREGLRAR